jgi:hypothetical protein
LKREGFLGHALPLAGSVSRSSSVRRNRQTLFSYSEREQILPRQAEAELGLEPVVEVMKSVRSSTFSPGLGSSRVTQCSSAEEIWWLTFIVSAPARTPGRCWLLVVGLDRRRHRYLPFPGGLLRRQISQASSFSRLDTHLSGSNRARTSPAAVKTAGLLTRAFPPASSCSHPAARISMRGNRRECCAAYQSPPRPPYRP